MNYRREIDGLRALAVLPVIFFHAGFETFSGGFIGVDVFFVISGYLITTILLTDLEQGTFSIANFYERRARRILPALLLVMLVSIPFAWLLLLPKSLVSFSKSLLSTSTFWSNIFFWSERGYFGTATELKPLIHTWSLAVEEQYYVFFPLLLLIFSRQKRILRLTLTALLICSFGLCIWLTKIHQDSAFFLLPTRLWELLVGSMVAIRLLKAKDNFSTTTFKSAFFELLGFFLILLPIFYYDKTTSFPGYAALAPVLGTALIISYSSSASPIGRILGRPIFVYPGLISYSAYLWHQPIFAFARHYHDTSISLYFYILAIGLTFLIAYFSWKYVEQPCRKLTIPRQSIFTYSTAGLLFFALAGIIGVQNNGFLDRYSNEDVAILTNTVNATTYVSERFDKLKLTQLQVDGAKKKIVLIGDSYAKDLINAIHESGLDDKLQFTTHQINSECGNLYLKEEFTHNINISKLPRCKLLGWYDGDSLRNLISQADAIWLASSWSLWVAELLPHSINNLKNDFGIPVFVFGTKNFGDITVKNLLGIPYNQRILFSKRIRPSSLEVQNLMRKNLSGYNFIDIGALICGQASLTCRIFNDHGEPLSFDGGHLTKAGAKFLGEALIRSKSLNAFLE